MIDDQTIKEYYQNKNIHNWNNIPEEHKEYLKNRFKDSESFKESVWRILYHIEERPVCPVCGNKVLFYGRKKTIFAKTCSISCGAKKSKIKRENTCLKHNGTKYPIQNKEIFNKIKQTCLERYNVENPYQLEKIKETRKKKYGVEYLLQSKEIIEKCQQTFLDNYGYISPAKNEEIKQKIKETQLIRYGGNPGFKSGELKNLQKSYLTKKKNNSFNKSKPEDESYILLKEKYQEVKRQYKSELYPFACDFYIPSLDLYIECNYHWTHGGKIYEGTEEDDKILQHWKEKNTKFYNNAIKTWTYYDVEKNNIAKQNNLNYIIFWNINELKDWLLK